MAGKADAVPFRMKPSFVTGANAKIKAGGLTFAYAQDVSYRVTVDVIPVETMGRYEVVTNEPVNYSVAGELSIVRYTKVAKENGMRGAHTDGNGLGNAKWVGDGSGKGSDQINPGNLLMSKTWDLQVFQKIQSDRTTDGTEGAATEGAVTEVNDPPVITITHCRFTNKAGGLNKRGILVERLSFVGVLASDDSFTASYSGDEDLAK